VTLKSKQQFKFVFLSAAIFLSAMLLFQNCGQVQVSELVSTPEPSTGITGQLCVSYGAGPRFIKTKVYVLNLTAKPAGHNIIPDSDMDGLSDELEISSGQYSVTNRRTDGVLDSICYRRGTFGGCAPLPGSCNPATKYFDNAINECDVSTFNGNGGPKGLNTDGVNKVDLIPDFIEALRWTAVASEDADISTDRDAVTNEQEIINFTDPNDENSVEQPAINRIVFTQSLDSTPHSSCNGQDSWSFSINQFPTVPVRAYTDAGGVLSHAQDENVGVIVVVSRNPVNGEIRYYSHFFKVMHGTAQANLNIQPNQFTLQGSY
jgi:hypothetical protein